MLKKEKSFMCREIPHSFTQGFKEIGLLLKSLCNFADIHNGRAHYLCSVEVFGGNLGQ